YYYSMDGGQTWTQGRLSSSYGVWGDPAVTFDANGNLFFGHLSNPPSPGYWIDRIVVQKSTNGGQTWNDGVGIGFSPPQKNQDKEWLIADWTDSPYRNNVYMAWTEFDSYGSSSVFDSTRILFSRTTDAGTTWSTPARISDHGGNCIDEDETVEGAVPAVGPNGEVVVAWSGPLGIMFDKSTDGGVTWGTDTYVTSQPGGWDYAVPGIYRANGLPVTACDISNSPYRGNIYVQWTDQRNGTGNTDAFIIKSTDGGTTWGTVVRVNDDSSLRHQFFSWMTIDQTTGNIYVCFYDRRNTTGNATDFFVAKSTDGGETFTNVKVSDTSFTPSSGIFFGDYSCIAAHNGKVYPLWMRLDGSKLSVWTAPFEDKYQFMLSVNQKWNMVSVPLVVDDFRKSELFPSAESPAFAYEGNYIVKETLALGAGYWMKFPSPDTVQFEGTRIPFDTLDLREQWNMLGSVSQTVAVGSIMSIPSGIINSPFYTFDGKRYGSVDSLFPGTATFVKASQDGKLVLASAAQAHEKSIQPVEITQEQVNISSGNLITYNVQARGTVTLKIFEREGEAIATLVDDVRDAGTHQVAWKPERMDVGRYYYWLCVRSITDKEKLPVVETGKLH
ncbi:MAG: exo-alpha-sialidase, partial [Ignavibacteriae bacterium]|nr:exo-alpha-sialidase [Ignavibacteriota bacterium]